MSAIRVERSLTVREKWERYEQEKARLQALELSPKEYERQIRALCERLRL